MRKVGPEGVQEPCRIKSITVFQQSGHDLIRIETDLPLGVYPYEGSPQHLEFTTTKGSGVQYVIDNFKIVPTWITG